MADDTNTAEREAIIRAAVAAMPHTNPLVADDLLGGFTMHTEADDIVAIFQAGRASLAASAGSEPVATEFPPMPETWHVSAHVLGQPILTIGYDWLAGKGELSDAETQAVIGMAQHLLAFVGYGLPPSNFDPDADDKEASHPSPPEGMAGWKLVPVEPTEEMKTAAVKYANGTAVYKNVKAEVLRIEEGIYGEVYEAMIAAAPPLPASEAKEL